MMIINIHIEDDDKVIVIIENLDEDDIKMTLRIILKTMIVKTMQKTNVNIKKSL